MPNLKISQLSQLTDPTGSDVMPIVNNSITKKLDLISFDNAIINQRNITLNRFDMEAYNVTYKNGTKNNARQVVHITPGIDSNSGGNILSFTDYINYTNPVSTNIYGATIDYVLFEDNTYYTLEVGTINVGLYPNTAQGSFDLSFSNTFSYQSQNINTTKIPEIISPGTFDIHPVNNPGNPLYLTITITKQPGDYDFGSFTFKGLITFL